jgi:hypothetical protein
VTHEPLGPQAAGGIFPRSSGEGAATKAGIRIAASSYDEDWSAMRYATPAGPLIVRINDIEKPETDVPHRTGFVARLLAETGGREPEEYIRSAKGLFDGVYANFDTPIVCPGGAECLRLGFYAQDLAQAFLYSALG